MTGYLESLKENSGYGPWRASCPDCDWEITPRLENTARKQSEYHRRSTGHEEPTVERINEEP